MREGGKQQLNFEKKKDGKCWTCGEIFSDTHALHKSFTIAKQNKKRTLQRIAPTKKTTPNPNPEENMPRISLAYITGIAQPQTLKLKRHIKKHNVIVLTDSGSTHNFINVSVAKRLNIFAYPVANLNVMVADGKRIDGVGKRHKVKMQLNKYEMEHNFYRCRIWFDFNDMFNFPFRG